MAEARDNRSSAPRTPVSDSAGFLLARIGFAAARKFARRLDPLGLEPRHVGLMRAVAEAEGRSQHALGELLRIPPSRMVTLVDELEQRRLVERRRNPTDRRAHALHLTSAGRKMLGRAMGVADEHEAEVCAGLSTAEHDQLVMLLHRVAAGLGVAEPGLPDQSSVANGSPCADGPSY